MRMRGFLKILVILLVLLGGAFWLLRDFLLEKTVERVLVSDEPVLLAPGWYLDGADWQSLGWEGLMNSLMSKGVFEVSRVNEQGETISQLQFSVESLKVLPQTRLAGVSWTLTGTDIRVLISGHVSFVPGADLPEADKVWQEIWLELDAFSLQTEESGWVGQEMNPATAILNSWNHLQKTGWLPGEQSLQGKIWIRFPKQVLYFELSSNTEAGQTWLTTREQDMRQAAVIFEETLTDTEVGLFSRYPLRLPVLLAIKDYARNIAFRAYLNDQTLSEPAYRHLLWSYLLTREYGPDFARRVTDAHEVGETGNTPEKTAADLHNNRVGRELFQQGTPIEQLLEIAKKDPRVQRVP